MNEINKEEFKKDIENYAKVLFRKSIKEASDQEKFQAVSYAVKDIVVDQWMATHKTYEEQDVKTVYYLSMEFLTGRALYLDRLPDRGKGKSFKNERHTQENSVWNRTFDSTCSYGWMYFLYRIYCDSL